MAASRASARDPYLDQARGVASLIMIHGHAFDAWVSAEGKAQTSYAVSRFFATLPLPAFLVLCGVALYHRIAAACHRAEPGPRLRRALWRRGTQLVLVGYGVNALSAWMDGVGSWATIWRADVLQVIGLSIAVVGLCTPHGPPSLLLRPMLARAGLVATGMLGVFVPLSRWVSSESPHWPRPLQVLVGPFTDVPAITRMPLCPLFAWVALGLVAGAWQGSGWRREAPRPRVTAALAASAVLFALGCHRATEFVATGAVLTRAHWGAAWNLLDYGARGIALFALSPWVAALLPAVAKRCLERLGSASLWAYVVHIPFCYGRWGASLRSRLTVPEAVPWMIALMALSYAVVLLRLNGRHVLSLLRPRSTAT